VLKGSVYENRFNGFPLVAKETIKMVSQQCQRLSTGLKPGVNETTFEAKPWQTQISDGVSDLHARDCAPA